MFGAVNELVLVRDPRDVICSAKFFWNRNFDNSITVIRNGLQAITRQRVESGLRQHVVRYEDLVLKPQEVMTDLCAFLGLACVPWMSGTETESRVFRTHGTSQSPEASIGRWRHELSVGNIAVANREFAPYLRRYGYGDG